MISNTETLFLKKSVYKYITKYDDDKNITSDGCIHNIIKGQHGNCQMQYVIDHDQFFELNPTMVLISNGNVTFENTCGASNRSFEGNFLIKFINCSVTINGITFSNIQVSFKESPLFLPMQNLKINTSNLLKEFNVTELSILHRETRKQIEHLNTNHENTIIILSVGFGATTFLVIILFSLIICYCNRYKP